jgi:hypothetical protein
MDRSLRFHRTHLGADTLKHPPDDLKPRCRQLLMVLNGRMSVGQLQDNLSRFENLDATLQDMWTRGLIAPTQDDNQADDLSDKLDTANHRHTDTGNNFDDARQHAVDMMSALFGSNSPHVRKLAATASEAALLQEVATCKRILGAVASASKASQFEDTVTGILKAAR